MRFLPFAAVTLFLMPLSVPMRAAIIESVNDGAIPHPTQSWSATDVGWAYTPSLTYLLTGVDTRFRTADARTVTVEIYSGIPLNGGTLLRSAGFTPLSGAYAGGTFVPLLVTAGQEIFIGFRNIAGLGANTALAADGPQSLGPDYYDFDGSGSYEINFPFTTGDIDRPILLLNGEFQASAVPEPATYVLTASSLLCLAAIRRWVIPAALHRERVVVREVPAEGVELPGRFALVDGCEPEKPVRVRGSRPVTFRNVRSWAIHVEVR